MGFHYLFDELEYRQRCNETTTEDMISFIPGHIGRIQARLRDLSKLKTVWDIDIIESDSGKVVVFGDQFKVFVPKEHWKLFQEKFLHKQKIEEKIQTDATLLEKKIKRAIIKFFKRKPFQDLILICELWRQNFPDSSFLPVEDSIINLKTIKQDINALVEKVLKYDRGQIDLFIDALDSGGRNITAFEDFNKNFILGARIEKRGIGILNCNINTALHIYLTIEIKDDDLLAKLKEANPRLTVLGKVIFPIPTFSKISKIIDDIKQLEDEL